MKFPERVEVGQLYEIITDNFFTTDCSNKVSRPVKLKKHEVIEIRYPHAWHFRTMDNLYFHAEEQMIRDNCNYFGKILGEVRFRNRADLDEILRLQLYDGENYFQLLLRQGLIEEKAHEILKG